MKILFFHRWVGVHAGGTETHLLELAKRFSQRGHSVAILTRQGDRLHDLDAPIRVYRVSRNLFESLHSYDDFRVFIHTGLFIIKSLVVLFCLYFAGKRFDVISVHFATEALVARLFRFFTRTPFLFVLEGYTPLEAHMARYADARIAISQYEADIYKNNHGVEAEVIPVGIDTKRFALRDEEGRSFREKIAALDKVVFLTVCRLEPRKDLFTLIEAAKLVYEKNKNCVFLVAGDGILRNEIKRKIDTENLSSFITLLGFVPDAALAGYYAASDVFVLTSKEEWFGIVFLEAMAAGLPIVATHVDACPEVVGNAGVFFKKGDYRMLAQILARLIEEKDRRNELARNARVRSHAFEWDQVIIRYESAYMRLVRSAHV